MTSIDVSGRLRPALNRLATSCDLASVCDLTEPRGLTQPTVSHHLEELVTVGLLDREQRGAWAFYPFDHDTMRRLAEAVVLDIDRRGASR